MNGKTQRTFFSPTLPPVNNINFYSDEEEDQTLLYASKSFRRPKPDRRWFLYRHWEFICIQLFLLCIYTAVFLSFADFTPIGLPPPYMRVYSPAQDAVRFEKVRYNTTLVIDSPYNGLPGPEVNKAWSDLLENMNIAVSGDDLAKIGASSIAIPGQENSYIAGLSVYHELHCLKRIRQYTWFDYYHANLDAKGKRLNRLHADHCIDVLHQAILCRADPALFTLEWAAAETMPRADFSHEHTCVDWRALFKWAGDRRVSKDILKNLKHPTKGLAFPDGVGSLLRATED